MDEDRAHDYREDVPVGMGPPRATSASASLGETSTPALHEKETDDPRPEDDYLRLSPLEWET